MYKRKMGEGSKTFVLVEDIDAVLAKVKRLGGRIVIQKTEIQGVGPVAIIQDTEGNGIGIRKPSMKE